jgi:hypothetical protein
MRQKSIEAELTKRRLQSNRYNMKGYSMHLRQLPKDGTLAVASSKLIVKNVQNFRVLCHAENMIDDDDAMIECALLNLAASRRHKDRAPSSMILHRHLQNQNNQQFSLQQNSIVHQKLKGKTDPETEIMQVHINNSVATNPPVSTVNDTKPLVTTTFLQLFDLDSSRSGRTNECYARHEESSRRIEVYTPVKEMMATDQALRMNAPDRPVGVLMPTLMTRTEFQLRKAFNPSSPILELAAPYSKNFVENYKSKIRHSRLGPLFGNMQPKSAPKSDIRQVKCRENVQDKEVNRYFQQELSPLDGAASPFQRFQRLPTAESILVSTPSRGSQNDSEYGFGRDTPIPDQTYEGHIVETRPNWEADLEMEACEALEREHMLEQVQNMYSHVSILKDTTKSQATGPKRSMSHLQERLAPMAESSMNFATTAEYEAVKSTKQTSSFRNLHVVIPHNEDRLLPAKVPLAVDKTVRATKQSRMPETIAALPSPYRMSVNILRPFESIVDLAQSQCASPFGMTKNNHHSTPVEVMFASANILNPLT